MDIGFGAAGAPTQFSQQPQAQTWGQFGMTMAQDALKGAQGVTEQYWNPQTRQWQ